MPTYEGLRLKILKYWRIGFADYRKKKLKSTDFTIISNNCWGGMIYESYNLPKESPTVYCLTVKIRLKSSSCTTIVSRKQEKSGNVEYRELTGISYW